MDQAASDQPALAAAGVAIEQRGPVLLLRLARPAKRNALNDAMIAAIGRLFADLPPGTRAVVIHAEGNHFCAGC